MRLSHYLTRSISVRFGFRIGVLADLREFMGRDFIKPSLGANLLPARLALFGRSSSDAAAFGALRERGTMKNNEFGRRPFVRDGEWETGVTKSSLLVVSVCGQPTPMITPVPSKRWKP